MATYMRIKGTADMADSDTLQCDACTEFDSEGFALPKGRCWVPLWADGREPWIVSGERAPSPCVICGVALIGRM